MKNFYTKDLLRDLGELVIVGDFTYGKPKVMHWGENAKLKIGNFCSIADDVTIFLGGNHRIDWITTYPFSSLPAEWSEAIDIKGHPATKGNVEIGNDVWIGYGATIMSGVKIGDGAVVGAKAVVVKDVQPYSIVAGNPAKEIKKRFDDKLIKKLIELKWWNWPIEKIKLKINILCSIDIDKL